MALREMRSSSSDLGGKRGEIMTVFELLSGFFYRTRKETTSKTASVSKGEVVVSDKANSPGLHKGRRTLRRAGASQSQE